MASNLRLVLAGISVATMATSCGPDPLPLVVCGTSGQDCCAGGTCDSGLTCTSGTCQTPVVCGASGQACCSGATCNSGLACTSGTCQTPAVCGASGQVCCTGATCNGELTCTSGICQTPPSAPRAPTGLTVSGVAQTTATLHWKDNADNEWSYAVGTCSGLVSVDGDGVRHCMTGFSQAATAPANATSYTLTGLTPDTTYGYYVLARNGGGSSGSIGIEFTTTSATTTLEIVNHHCLPIDELTLGGGANLLTSSIASGSQRTLAVRPGTYAVAARSILDGVTWSAVRTVPAVGLVLPLDMPAGTGCLRFNNVSGYFIYELYVAGLGWGCSNGLWGADYINGYFSPSSSFTISLLTPGNYDILAYTSNRTRLWSNCKQAATAITAGHTTQFNLTP